MTVGKKKIVLTLIAQAFVEYTEVIEVDGDITPDQLKELKAQRRNDVDMDAYHLDPETFHFDRSTIEDVPEGLDAETDAVVRIKDGKVWFHPVAKTEVTQ